MWQPRQTSFGTGILDLYLFCRLSEVRDITERWIEKYNEERPYKSLGKLTPVKCWQKNGLEKSNFEWYKKR